jgi:uncharacterized membrane protein
MMTPVKEHLRNKLLAGVFAVIPVAVTGFVIWYVETRTRTLFRVDIPFLGLGIAVLAIYGLGVVVTSLLGKWMLGLADRWLGRMPVLREVYAAWKQVVVTPGGSAGMFAKVVLVADGNGRWVVGFTSGEMIGEGMQCVFVPAAPNPTSGRLCLVPVGQCRVVDVSTEEAFKMILSGGNFVPAGIVASC